MGIEKITSTYLISLLSSLEQLPAGQVRELESVSTSKNTKLQRARIKLVASIILCKVSDQIDSSCGKLKTSARSQSYSVESPWTRGMYRMIKIYDNDREFSSSSTRNTRGER
jgi:hypothetical protein